MNEVESSTFFKSDSLAAEELFVLLFNHGTMNNEGHVLIFEQFVNMLGVIEELSAMQWFTEDGANLSAPIILSASWRIASEIKRMHWIITIPMEQASLVARFSTPVIIFCGVH